jgi:hypothetical protein
MIDDRDLEKNAKDRELLEKIFCFTPPEEEVPQSWQAWRAGESDYKPFSLQFRECNKDGTMLLEKCNVCGHELIMCKKYGGQCSSKKCRGASTEKMEEL